MSRGAWIPIRTFSPMIESTETSMSSPIMIDWFDLRVSTSMAPSPCRVERCIDRTPPDLPSPSKCADRTEVSAISPSVQWGLHLTGFHSGALVSPPAMSRRSLRPQLNQIRGWVRQGRTDAWIAHQLEVTVQQIQAFKRENDLEANGDATEAFEEVDLRAEDDAAIAAELEAEEARRAEEEARLAEEAAKRAADEDAEPEGEEGGDEPPAPRRRARRGGRTRARRDASQPLEGTFDHGEEGYGLWLDPAVEDNPVYAEHWAGHRPVEVTIEAAQIVSRRAAVDGDDED